MTTAEYLRIHANASPAKLRNIIKNQIFVHDDVHYLKRLVKDLGGMDYVFRFLWYDGHVPTQDDVSGGSGRSGIESCAGNCGGKQSRVPKSVEGNSNSNSRESTKRATYGRTWIQYCCYHNAHQCLQWIFQAIVRNHLSKQQQYQKRRQLQQRLTDVSSVTMSGSERPTDASGSSKDDKDDYDDGSQTHLEKIIKELLEFPSASYCGTHYVAVGESLEFPPA